MDFIAAAAPLSTWIDPSFIGETPTTNPEHREEVSIRRSGKETYIPGSPSPFFEPRERGVNRVNTKETRKWCNRRWEGGPPANRYRI